MADVDRCAALSLTLVFMVGGWMKASGSPFGVHPAFGSSAEADDIADRAAAAHFLSWDRGVGMACFYHRLARARALHSRLLAYSDEHQRVFVGAPSPSHVVAVAQLVSQRREFRGLRSLDAPLDRCGCRRCFPDLWLDARTLELDDITAAERALEHVMSTPPTNKGVVHPPAHASHYRNTARAYCPHQNPQSAERAVRS
jgi:hypothetical protein